ncbi:hypothetical protein, partial [Klebsiella pneumoniae]|uniref:hypothetical protein n=1 Tax=Klebsiella pneumoniae TaxID=573 RepID=UPI00280ABE20
MSVIRNANDNKFPKTSMLVVFITVMMLFLKVSQFITVYTISKIKKTHKAKPNVRIGNAFPSNFSFFSAMIAT